MQHRAHTVHLSAPPLLAALIFMGCLSIRDDQVGVSVGSGAVILVVGLVYVALQFVSSVRHPEPLWYFGPREEAHPSMSDGHAVSTPSSLATTASGKSRSGSFVASAARKSSMDPAKPAPPADDTLPGLPPARPTGDDAHLTYADVVRRQSSAARAAVSTTAATAPRAGLGVPGGNPFAPHPGAAVKGSDLEAAAATV